MKETRMFVPQVLIPALLDGCKTQHREIVKNLSGDCEAIRATDVPGVFYVDCRSHITGREAPVRPGDIVWAPETWAHTADSLKSLRSAVEDLMPDHTDGPYYLVGECAPDQLRWRSAATMPAWASRIRRTVKAVRVQRLQEISYDECEAEGGREEVFDSGTERMTSSWSFGDCGSSSCAVEAYCFFWESLHGPGSWDINDWVWVYEFEPAEAKTV